MPSLITLIFVFVTVAHIAQGRHSTSASTAHSTFTGSLHCFRSAGFVDGAARPHKDCETTGAKVHVQFKQAGSVLPEAAQLQIRDAVAAVNRCRPCPCPCSVSRKHPSHRASQRTRPSWQAHASRPSLAPIASTPASRF